MKIRRVIRSTPPVIALTLTAALLVPMERVSAFSTLGGELGFTQRDFRVFNNFEDFHANNNSTEDPNLPGYSQCFAAFWKGAIEWSSELHGGSGDGDPLQLGDLGSGGANFDAFWGGETSDIGGSNGNVISSISSCGGGVLAYCEIPISNGWRIRFCEEWQWDDRPGGPQNNRMDLQGVAAHEYGHALGLDHSDDGSATMYPTVSGDGTSQRSIAADDIAGVQFIYGVRAADKPKITAVSISGDSMTITGQNFSSSGNQVWLTNANVSAPTGYPKVTVENLSSDGTTITLTIPSTAGPGNVMVKTSGTGNDDMSNAWPVDIIISEPCDAPQNYCSSTPNSGSPFGAFMGFSGTASYSANDLVLECYGAAPDQFGIFYYGPSQVSTSFGNGVRCVGAGFLGTFRLPVIQTDNIGDASYALDYGQPPMSSGNGAIVDGMEFNFQFWFRDPPAGGSNFNLSDGLKVVFCP